MNRLLLGLLFCGCACRGPGAPPEDAGVPAGALSALVAEAVLPDGGSRAADTVDALAGAPRAIDLEPRMDNDLFLPAIDTGPGFDVDQRLVAAEPVVMGALDKDVVWAVIRSNRGQIRSCSAQPGLTGKVTVKFIISSTGAVTTANVAQTTVGNAELEACMLGRVRRWMFPRPKRGAVVIVTYHFHFGD